MIRYPNITGKTDAQKLEQMRSYMHQLADELNYQLEKGGSAQGGNPTTARATAAAIAKPVKNDSAISSFNEIKALIIKSADIVDAYSEEIKKSLEGEYVAVSDFGTYKEETQAQLTASSDQIQVVLDKQEEIETDMGTLEENMRAEIKATAESIKLEVTGGEPGKTASIKLSVGEGDDKKEYTGTIDMTGMVTFTNLTDGKTTISGDNITTGQILADLIKAGVIKSKDGESVVIDLDNGAVNLVGVIKSQQEAGKRTMLTPDTVTAQSLYDGLYAHLLPGALQLQDATNKLYSNMRPGEWVMDDASGDYKIVVQTDTENKFSLITLQGKNATQPLQIVAMNTGENLIRGLSAPTTASDAVNKGYADSKYIPATSGGINANTAYDGGLYMCVGGSSNLPSGSQYGSLLVLPYRKLSGNTYQDFVTQIFMPNGDDSSKPNSFFYRTSTKNAWNGWKEVAIKDDLSGYLPLSGGTLTGELNCKNINASNEYLTGSLYVGGKKSTTDGRNGVAFGASGNVTMQGADSPTINFIRASATSAQASIALSSSSNQMNIKANGNILLYPASANGKYFAFLDASMYHSTDNAVACGASTKRWSTVYAGTGTINTSDRNEKENIRDIDEKYIQLFEKLRPVTYAFIGGKHDRTHIGYISQEVKDAMDEVGLTDLEFAGYCRDKKTEDVLDENGVLLGTKDVLDENGEPTYRYALRYAEFIALNTKMIQLQQAKIEALEQKLAELTAKVDALRI